MTQSKKRLLIGSIFVIVFAAGIGLGVLVQREVAANGLNGHPDVAGNSNAAPPAPPLEDWRYPGADSRGYTEAPGFSEHGRIVVPYTRVQMWVTPDDYDKVIAFYTLKCGSELNGGSGVSGIATRNGDLWLYLSPDDRPQQQCLRRRTGSYDLTIFIARAEEAGRTQIVLVYEPKVIREKKGE